MKLSVVVSIQPARFQAATFKGELEANLSYIASLGYDGAELAIRDPALIDMHALESLLQTYRLKVPAVGTGQAWGEERLSLTDPSPEIRSAAIARIKGHLPFAARRGAIIIVGLIRGTVRPGLHRRQAMEWLIAGLRECCQAAAADGVSLALEPINRSETTLINNAVQGLALIQQVGAKNLGLLLDTFHMSLEESVIEDSIRACGRHILHFHVADSNRCQPGAGHLNFRSILGTLFDTGYQGWISGEFLPEPDAQTAAAKNIAYLQAISLPVS